MRSLVRIISKPEYFFQPKQAFRRAFYFLNDKAVSECIHLPWGDSIQVNVQETVGKSIAHFGIYDLALTECLWRLLNRGDHALDIGANIGYFSLLMSYRVGIHGSVESFEPHPVIAKRWQENLKNKKQCQLHAVALSTHSGKGHLQIPVSFAGNEGTASLEVTAESTNTVPVEIKALDDVIASQVPLKVIKIDVEGHELSVLLGAENTLARTQNVVFEDFKHHESPVIDFLRKNNFTVFRLKKGFAGVELVDVKKSAELPLWEPPNFIATRNPQEIKPLFASKGWRSLKASE